eukprot:CAMPEP_0194221818 /NCGR_PEP_ID=MMETSP0156-20130528/31430_1 /TAXON_ID=33649 /ORGANISM="Thalassionema nitzschioides, Strain L26-B" /LENGTH=77 /DNA_ID=CAMNT_0038952353 /DNA_START=51 /DNA_END=280 /DNA_ORIENTATION=-
MIGNRQHQKRSFSSCSFSANVGTSLSVDSGGLFSPSEWKLSPLYESSLSWYDDSSLSESGRGAMFVVYDGGGSSPLG